MNREAKKARRQEERHAKERQKDEERRRREEEKDRELAERAAERNRRPRTPRARNAIPHEPAIAAGRRSQSPPKTKNDGKRSGSGSPPRSSRGLASTA